MATESDLRDRFHGEPRGDGGLDAALIVRRARRRRIPKQLAIGGAAALVVVAIAVPAASFGRAFLGGGSASSGAAPAAQGRSGSAPDDGAQGQSGGALGSGGDPDRAPGAAIGTCTGTGIAAASDAGLAVTVAFPSATAGSASVAGSVTLTNTGTRTIAGTVGSAPAVYVAASDGTLVATAVGGLPHAATRIELAPGESLAYPVTLPLVGCASGHPALGAGAYTATATIQFHAGADQQPASGSGSGSELVGGTASGFSLG